MTEYDRFHVDEITNPEGFNILLGFHNAILKEGGEVVAPIYRIGELRKKTENNGYASIIV